MKKLKIGMVNDLRFGHKTQMDSIERRSYGSESNVWLFGDGTQLNTRNLVGGFIMELI